jgi:hypothetical protein
MGERRAIPAHLDGWRGVVCHPATFLGLTAVVYAAAVAVVGVLPAVDGATVVATALTVDLAVVVPALYALLLVRGRGWPALSVVPVFLASVAGAALVLPAEHRGALHWLEWVAAPAELLLVGFLAHRALGAARAWRKTAGAEGDGAAPDVFEHLRRAAHETLPVPAVAEILAYEVAVLWYALFAWRARPHLGDARAAFTHHRRLGYGAVAAGLMMVVAVEVVPVHLLLALWSPAAAWGLTALSVYSLLWLLGDYRAMVLRPTLLRRKGEGDVLEVRVGVRWNLSVPLSDVRSLRRAGAAPPPTLTPGYLRATPIGAPRLLLELAEPVVARGPYGWRREVSLLGLTVDDEPAFEELLAGAPADVPVNAERPGRAG